MYMVDNPLSRIINEDPSNHPQREALCVNDMQCNETQAVDDIVKSRVTRKRTQSGKWK